MQEIDFLLRLLHAAAVGGVRIPRRGGAARLSTDHVDYGMEAADWENPLPG